MRGGRRRVGVLLLYCISPGLVLPVLGPGRGSGDTHIVRQAGHAHVVFAVRAVAVVGILSIAGELTQGVRVLGQGNAVGLHPRTDR